MRVEAIDYAVLIALLVLIALVVVGLLKARAWVKALRGDLRALQSSVRAGADENTAEIVNAVSLGALDFRFPVVLRGSSIDAHLARVLLHLLQEKRPRRVLELGAGSSTVIIARVLAALQRPAEVHIAVDHDGRFLEAARENARLNGVEALIRFVCCPLAPLEGYTLPWYSGVPELLREVKLDLVLVDGPPAYEQGRELARAPALPVLRPYLAPGATIVVDDAGRRGEREIVGRWARLYPEVEVSWIPQGRGVALLTLRD